MREAVRRAPAYERVMDDDAEFRWLRDDDDGRYNERCRAAAKEQVTLLRRRAA